ncbi:YopX family protein [Paenibacillus larvae]|uniref:YopX family protein n=1 Tax=Paenibacillus larvae TaxID=1464 RepID=UPI000310E81A|nr:YopX family protein [Paenibacillus larvae]
MNRPIKFRGKRIDNGEWVYGFYLYGAILDEHLIWTDNENWRVDYETVGQFTRLYDRNNVEIFEDDIVEIKNHPFDRFIEINGMYTVGYSDRMELCCGNWLLHHVLPYVTVVGNMYEHSHLLGGTEDE